MTPGTASRGFIFTELRHSPVAISSALLFKYRLTRHTTLCGELRVKALDRNLSAAIYAKTVVSVTKASQSFVERT